MRVTTKGVRIIAGSGRVLPTRRLVIAPLALKTATYTDRGGAAVMSTQDEYSGCAMGLRELYRWITVTEALEHSLPRQESSYATVPCGVYS